MNPFNNPNTFIPPSQPNVLHELQKMHQGSQALQETLLDRLNDLVRLQTEQNQLLQELIRSSHPRP